MSGITPYITATITILGIAYPILLQVISRIDDKYSSQNILELFNKEAWVKIFKFALIANLVFIVIWSLQLKPRINVGYGFTYLFINNSANFLVGISSILLVVSFFFLVNRVLIFYTPKRIVKYLSRKYNKSKKTDNRIEFVEGMGDMLIFCITKNEKNIRESISTFFYSVFNEEREKQHNKPVEYPEILYRINHFVIEELGNIGTKRNRIFENGIGGCQWILGQGEKHEISRETFSWIWSYLNLLVEYKKDDVIFFYWRNAHHYYQNGIPIIQKNYNETGVELIVTNEEEYAKRDSERLRFLEFQYFFGGLLLFGNRYDSLRRIFNYTTVDPPRYELLPNFMSEIFRFYNKVRDPYLREYPFISIQFPFPKNSGFGADSIVKRWVSSYMAILFLRQYSLHQYYYGLNPIDFPATPDNQGEINHWIESIDFFKRLVDEHLKNNKLLKTIGLDFLTPDWCEENKKIYPLEFIEEFKGKLQKAYREGQFFTPIDKSKRLQFEHSTKKILETTLESLFKISNPSIIKDEINTWSINGYHSLYERDAFAKKSEISYIDFHSFLANALSRKILHYFSITFNFKKNRTYLFKSENLFNAVEKLNPNKDYVIICFNLFLDFYMNQVKVKGLSKDDFKGIPILNFYGSDVVNHSLFILKKSDLPAIISKPIDNKFIEKYNLRRLSSNFDIFASVIDLNEAPQEILDENRQDPTDDEIKKSVLLNVHLNLEVQWKNKVDVVQIVEYSEYKQKGLESNLQDIIPFHHD